MTFDIIERKKKIKEILENTSIKWKLTIHPSELSLTECCLHKLTYFIT